MATRREDARTHSYRARIDEAITNGVSLISPLLWIICMGLVKSATAIKPNKKNMKNVGFGKASGSTFDWEIYTTQEESETTQGNLAELDFDEPNLLDRASVPYYMEHKTWAIGEGDLELNQNDKTKISNMRRDRMVHAQNAIYTKLAGWPWNIDETGHNGGLTMFSPTALAASTEYAGIAMDATDDSGNNSYWAPIGYDYDTLTLAANFVAIADALQRACTVSEGAGGDGGRIEPDFAVLDPLGWAEFVTYKESKAAWHNVENYNMYVRGFQNSVINNVCYFWDSKFGGSTGYVDGAAAEEILMGHSSKMKLVTTFDRKAGLVKSSGLKDQPWLTGEVGRFKTGMMALRFESPKFFGLAYT